MGDQNKRVFRAKTAGRELLATGSHIQVTRVHPGSPAERAGLQAGDTIVSANGYLTQDPGNLAWIINHHAPNGVVTLNIRKVANGQDATVNATLH